MATEPNFEFINDETRINMINQRLMAVEQEVLSTEIDLSIEEAMAAESSVIGDSAGVEMRRSAYDSAVAKMNALRSLRDGDTKKPKPEPEPEPEPVEPTPTPAAD